MELGHPQRRYRQGVLNTLLIVMALVFATTSAWAAGPKIFYDIPAGDASKTLQQYIAQTRIEMLYLADNVRGRITNPVHGNYEASDALAQMLYGTDLELTFNEDYSFVSVKPRAESLPGAAVHVDVPTASTRAESRDQTDYPREIIPEQKIAEVVITGTLIRGVLDVMSPLEVVTKKQMKKTAYATVQDALQALPLNFGGGPSEDFGTVGNFVRGSGVNLRGLGAGATLVLVNGHRQPYSSYEGDFVDVSNIPWNAVERIEVLPDGAAALYGSDAIAGVVNVIMRSDFDGAETQLRIGSAEGGAEEKLVAQLFGQSWDSGNLLFSYQYSERTSLAASERAYAASTDKRPLGGTDHRTYLSNPGNILDPRTFAPAFGLPANQDGTSLSSLNLLPGQINLHNPYEGVEILPDLKTHGFFLSGKQQLSERFELFGESRFSRREVDQDFYAPGQPLLVPSSNPFAARVNPYRGAPLVLVGYDFTDDLGQMHLNAVAKTFSGTFGINARVSDSWNIRLSESYGREALHPAPTNQVNQKALHAALSDSNPETAFNPFGDGSNTNPATIEAIRATLPLRSLSTIESASAVADGTVFNLPAGAAKLAVGAEGRAETLERESSVLRQFERSVKSAFAELSVPLIGKADDTRAVPRLELSLAGRYERYSDFGNASNPKIGLRWAPSNSVKLRTSWGTSFRAPKLVDLYDSFNDVAGVVPLKDPRSASGSSVALALFGSNPDLKEERASTWTAGFDFAPSSVEGLALSLTYYSINYDDRIQVPGPQVPSDILLQESQWASVINRNPTAAEVSALCESPVFSGSVSQCKSTPIAAIVDYRVRNMAQTRVHGVDLKLDQTLRTRHGRFDFGLNGGYVFDFQQAASDTSPLKSVLNTVGNPLSFRMRGTAEWYERDWNKPGFGASATIEYFGGYSDPSTVRPVNSLATVDLSLSYRTAGGSGAFDGLEFGLNGKNVLNEAPPFVDREAGYDQANAEPFGRVLSFSIQKNW